MCGRNARCDVARIHVLHTKMEEQSVINTDESVAEAERLAHIILSHAWLPIFYEVRAHTCLGLGETNYLYHAFEAVRVAKVGVASYPKDRPVVEQKQMQQLLSEAEKCLRYAIRDAWELIIMEAADVKAGVKFDATKEPTRYGGRGSDDEDETATLCGGEESNDDTVVVSGRASPHNVDTSTETSVNIEAGTKSTVNVDTDLESPIDDETVSVSSSLNVETGSMSSLNVETDEESSVDAKKTGTESSVKVNGHH